MAIDRRSGAVFARCLRGLLLLALVSSFAARAQGQDLDVKRANQVKAAYLVNFLRYTNWPDTSFPAPDSPYRIVVAGSPELVDAVREIARAAGRVAGRSIEVQRIDLGALSVGGGSTMRAQVAEQLRASHLLFIERGEPDRSEELLALVRDFPVLTVSDLDRFAASGGMVELLERGPNIVLAANPAAIRRAELVVSAKVLKLARLVGATEGW